MDGLLKAWVIIMALMFVSLAAASMSEDYRDAHLGAACISSGGNWQPTTPSAKYYECVRKDK